MTRVALAALAVISVGFPMQTRAQDTTYVQKRAQVVKELQGAQSSLGELKSERMQLASRIENALAELTRQRAQALMLSNEQGALRQLDSLLTGAQDNLMSQRDRLQEIGEAARNRSGTVLVVLFRADSSGAMPVQNATLMVDGANQATRNYSDTARGALRLGAVDEVFRASVLPTPHAMTFTITANGQPMTQTVNVQPVGESVTYVQFALRDGQLVQTTWTSRGTTPF